MDLPEATSQMENVLVAAQMQRSKRNEWIDGELGWVIYEREEMRKAVESLRATLDLATLSDSTMDELVSKAEREATGHSDYTHKFSLYCAEAALYGKIGPIF